MSGGYTAIVIPLPDDDGVVRIRKVKCPAGDHASLRFLQDQVRTVEHSRGYIEHLCEPKGVVDFWFNEEGKLDGLPINNVATDLLGAMWPEWRGWDVIVGNVVLTGNRGPETVSVARGLWDQLKDVQWQANVVFEEGDG